MSLVVPMVCKADVISCYGEVGFDCEMCFADEHNIYLVLG